MHSYLTHPTLGCWQSMRNCLGLCLIVLMGYSPSFAKTAQKNLKKQSMKKVDSRSNSIAAPSSIPKKEKYSIALPMEFYGFSYNEGPDNSNVAGLQLIPSFTYSPIKQLRLRAGASVFLNSGRVQDRFILPNQTSTIFLREMVASYQPSSAANLQVGALDMDDLENYFLFWRRTFPGADASYTYQAKSWDITLGGRYAVPTSYSLEADRTQNEKLPGFLVGGVKARAEIGKSIGATAKVDYFQFSNLPSIAAYNGQVHGNQATGGLGSAKFLYQYKGWSQNYSVDLLWNKNWSNSLSLTSIDNLEAPVKRSRSQALSASLKYSNSKIAIEPSASYFYMESDATPAFYNASFLGHANRVGMNYGLRANFKKLGINIVGRYIDSKLLSKSLNQNDLQYFELGVEVPNAFF